MYVLCFNQLGFTLLPIKQLHHIKWSNLFPNISFGALWQLDPYVVLPDKKNFWHNIFKFLAVNKQIETYNHNVIRKKLFNLTCNYRFSGINCLIVEHLLLIMSGNKADLRNSTTTAQRCIFGKLSAIYNWQCRWDVDRL